MTKQSGRAYGRAIFDEIERGATDISTKMIEVGQRRSHGPFLIKLGQLS
jgi:hypothetical protein